MIGSHNTFTFLEPTNFIFRFLKRYWKCQEINIDEQYQIGIRMFDIRVFKNKHNEWQLCHGIVNLDMHFDSIKSLCHYIEENYPEAIYRIVIEKKYNEKDFPKEYAKIINDNFKNLWNIAYKGKGTWNILINKGKELGEYLNLNTWETPNIEINCSNHWNKEISLWENIKNFVFNTNIKECIINKSKNTQYFTDGNIDNKNYVIMSDYVNLLK